MVFLGLAQGYLGREGRAEFEWPRPIRKARVALASSRLWLFFSTLPLPSSFALPLVRFSVVVAVVDAIGRSPFCLH